MKKWLLILSLLGITACTSEDVSTPIPNDGAAGSVAVSSEALSLCLPDLSVYSAVKFYFNASDNEMHRFNEPGPFGQQYYWQVGGYAWNQPVRGRGRVAPVFDTYRVITFESCGQTSCIANGDHELCGCGGACYFY